jgi:hypothetical protein
VELVGGRGRRADKTAALAAELGGAPHDDYAELLESVAVVASAVPPKVQAQEAAERQLS